MADMTTEDLLLRLAATIAERRHASAAESYVARLQAAGLNKMLEKIGEEATEVIIAAKDAGAAGDRRALIGEVADLWFHCLVMLDELDSGPQDVLACLEERLGRPGLAEKAARNSTE